jgi:hypothetical protein
LNLTGKGSGFPGCDNCRESPIEAKGRKRRVDLLGGMVNRRFALRLAIEENGAVAAGRSD